MTINFFNFSSKKNIIIPVSQPEVQLSIVKRLGQPKFWVSNNDFYEVMEKIYKKASAAALERYYQQRGNGKSKGGQ